MERLEVLHVSSKLKIFRNLLPPVIFHLSSPLLQVLLGLLVLLLLPAASFIIKVLFVGLMESANEDANLWIILVKPVSVLPLDETQSMSGSGVDTFLEALPLFFHFSILWVETVQRFRDVFFEQTVATYQASNIELTDRLVLGCLPLLGKLDVYLAPE